MKTIEETFLVPCSTDAFWSAFLDDGYMRGLFGDVLQFKDFKILELTPTTRKVLTVPRMNLPSVLEKLIGDSFSYEEHGTLDRGANLWRWRMVQPEQEGGKKRKELVSTSGSIRVEAAGDGKCRRINQASIEGKVFGLGGIIESTAEKEVRSAWAKEATYLEQWLKRPRT